MTISMDIFSHKLWRVVFRRKVVCKTKVRKPQSRTLYKKHKETARSLVVERLEYLNLTYQVSWNQVSIRNQKTRWGSCSKKKNLNFNYKLALVPGHLADYVVAHELCHLQEFNHSKKFWDLVAQTIPDHKERRKELMSWRLK